MSYLAYLSRRIPGLGFAALTCVALTGCGSSSEPRAAEGASDVRVAAADPCATKACGVDCTPAGSDEPFNCTAQGKCVAAGQPLGCAVKPAACAGKTCGSDCTPAGSDEPFNCSASGECVAAGQSLGCATNLPACTGRACGADCTPAGSDEPFNCSASGQCVAVGQALGCTVPPDAG